MLRLRVGEIILLSFVALLLVGAGYLVDLGADVGEKLVGAPRLPYSKRRRSQLTCLDALLIATFFLVVAWLAKR